MPRPPDPEDIIFDAPTEDTGNDVSHSEVKATIQSESKQDQGESSSSLSLDVDKVVVEEIQVDKEAEKEEKMSMNETVSGVNTL